MRLELPARRRLVHTTTVPIRWGDMDAMGHVNNTVYFRYMEIARVDWFHAIGCPLNPQGEGPVILNAFCNFHRQLEYPGDVVVRTYTSDPGRSTFETWCTLERADQPGEPYATGGATAVWVDFPRQKSAPLPDWMRALVAD